MSRAISRVVLCIVMMSGLCAADATAQAADSTRLEPSASVVLRPAPPRADSVQHAPPPDRSLGRDKLLHFTGSAALTLSAQYLATDKGGLSNTEALPLSAAVTLSVGLTKEVVDSRRDRHPLFSWKDLAADVLGVLLAAGFIAL